LLKRLKNQEPPVKRRLLERNTDLRLADRECVDPVLNWNKLARRNPDPHIAFLQNKPIIDHGTDLITIDPQ
jgi:hypothetical protein